MSRKTWFVVHIGRGVNGFRYYYRDSDKPQRKFVPFAERGDAMDYGKHLFDKKGIKCAIMYLLESGIKKRYHESTFTRGIDW